MDRAAKTLHINLDPAPTAPRASRELSGPREPIEPVEPSSYAPEPSIEPAPRGSLVEEAVGAVPGLLRISAVTAAHAVGWGVRTYVRSVRRIVEAAQAADRVGDDGSAAGSVGDPDAGGEAGSDDGLGSDLSADQAGGTHPSTRASAGSDSSPERLRRTGEELLRRSGDVWDEDERHPAFVAILDELSPDEARILVLMSTSGAQPVVDVVEGGLFGTLRGSRTIAHGLTVIGSQAGVRFPSSASQHLDNLIRLGLVRHAEEPLADPARYQAVETQPVVLQALHSTSSARIKRRSIRLTAFGEDFARACFADVGDLEELTIRHALPDA